MKTRKHTPHKRVAILSAAITHSHDGWYQLLPAGHFNARDGRPDDVPGGQWFIDATIAAQFIAATAAVGQPVLFDYNHVTLKQDEDPAACAEAKAAAWLRDPRNDMQWRDGDGLYVRLSLTPPAQVAVDNGEWAYLSAVFPYDEAGHPLYLRMGALTNDPGLTGLKSMAALSARLDTLLSLPSQREDAFMHDYILQLLEKLGIELPEDTSELTEDVARELVGQALAAIDSLLASAQVAVDTLEVIDTTQDADAIVSDVTDIVDDSSTEIAEVEQILEEAVLNGLDITKYVPKKAYDLLARQAAVLSAQSKNGGADRLIETARREGRVVAAEIPVLRTIGRTQGVAVLSAMLKKRPPINAITRRQTTGLVKPAKGVAVLSASEKEAARLQGKTEAQYLKIKQAGAKK